MTGITHLTVEFNKERCHIRQTFALTAETRSDLQAWQAAQTNPTARDLAEWLAINRVPRDCDGSGPAVVETRPTGYRGEVYYKMDELHRPATEGPAVTETWPTGYRQEQDWEENRQLAVRRYGDSTGIGSLKPLTP